MILNQVSQYSYLLANDYQGWIADFCILLIATDRPDD